MAESTLLTRSHETGTKKKGAYNLDKSKPASSVIDLDRDDSDGEDYVDKLVKERNLSTLNRAVVQRGG